MNSNFGLMSTANVSLFTSARRNDSSSPIAVVTLIACPPQWSRTVNQHQHLRAHLVQQFIGIIDGNFDANARFTGNDHVIHFKVAVHVSPDAKGIGIPQPIQEFAAFLPPVGIENHGVNLPMLVSIPYPSRSICISE